MYGDFSRATYDPAKHYSSVAYQQGRVRLDAEDNELQAILRHSIRTAIADLLGAPATPNNGFQINYFADNGGSLTIRAGSYYVDGIRVENVATDDVPYWQQPYLVLDHDASTTLPTDDFGVYLRVWERTVSSAQDPLLREVALGDLTPDTALRGQLVWQVLTGPPVQRAPAPSGVLWPPLSSALLMAQAIQPSPPDQGPCEISPASQYRGPENQLYRVEVHTGGQQGTATYKWSRDNASVTFPLVQLDQAVATVTTLGRDGKTALEVGDTVEIVDDRTTFGLPGSAPQRLFQVAAVDTIDLTVTLTPTPDFTTDAGLHPILRRWDSPAPPTDTDTEPPKDGALWIVEGSWVTLEDGMQVQFSRADSDGDYESGDYWLIPARVATGDVEWPRSVTGQSIPRAPKGVEYHYAPLANVNVKSDNGSTDDLRSYITQLAAPMDRGTKTPGATPASPTTSASAATQAPADTPAPAGQAPAPQTQAAALPAPLAPTQHDPGVNPTAANRPEITPPVIFPGEPPTT